MRKPKIYSTFSFFKWAGGLSLLLLLIFLVLEWQLGLPVFLWGLGLVIFGFVLLGFRLVQLIYRLQLDRIHDVNQVEALLWIYRHFTPGVNLPPMRGIAGSPDFFTLLIEYYNEVKPAVIVEAGSGVSSIILSELLLKEQSETQHIALDHEALYTDLTRRKVRNPHSVVVHAPLRTFSINQQDWQWYDLDFVNNLAGPIDLLIIDGPPEPIQPLARYPALPLLWEHLSDKAVVILDDALRPDDRAIIERWKKEFQLEGDFVYTEKGACILRKR